jgi:hypothetical protein
MTTAAQHDLRVGNRASGDCSTLCPPDHAPIYTFRGYSYPSCPRRPSKLPDLALDAEFTLLSGPQQLDAVCNLRPCGYLNTMQLCSVTCTVLNGSELGSRLPSSRSDRRPGYCDACRGRHEHRCPGQAGPQSCSSVGSRRLDTPLAAPRAHEAYPSWPRTPSGVKRRTI